MKCNWIEKKLGDLIESVSIKHKFDKKEIILINTSDVLEGKVLNHTHVENSDLRGQFKKSFMKGDILYSEIRPQNKRFAFVDFDSEDYVASTKLMVLRRKTDEITEQFLFQILKSNNLIRELQAIAESRSGTFPQITFSELSNITILLPPREEQERIVNTLSSLDKKYELNKEIIETLEETASTLFKHWFIDFEFPDENENPYKLSGGKLVDSELGEIPEGWEICNLEDIAEIVMGQSPKSDTYNNENIGIPLINGASDFKKGYINPLKYTSDPKKKSQPGDYVFGVRATVGNVTYVDKEYALGRGVGIARSKMKSLNEFLYFVLVKGINYLESTATGSVYINLSKDDFRLMKLTSPPESLINAFHRITTNIFEEINLKYQENLALQELRDTLLPKLLSGEIELPTEAEV